MPRFDETVVHEVEDNGGVVMYYAEQQSLGSTLGMLLGGRYGSENIGKRSQRPLVGDVRSQNPLNLWCIWKGLVSLVVCLEQRDLVIRMKV